MTQDLGVIYFPAAVALGALHALEPGHAKALTASYLIGIKGTKKDSILLGLSVAATHSLVVILISAIGLWIGNEAFTGQATQWLERGSGFVAIAIGSWMLYRRVFIKRFPHEHHHQADPVVINGSSLKGRMDIVATPLGEKMRFSALPSIALKTNELRVEIDRAGASEMLHLIRSTADRSVFISEETPAEPHEFKATLIGPNNDLVGFEMFEPEGHHHEHEEHSHAHLDDEAHAAAHAATLPNYVNSGEKPTPMQIITFGAAGGMIPCPASITVMLLALSTGRAAMGVFTVLGFSLGLALALVGVGIAIVTGLSKLSAAGRLTWVTNHAPVASACLVIASGCAALLFAK